MSFFACSVPYRYPFVTFAACEKTESRDLYRAPGTVLQITLHETRMWRYYFRSAWRNLFNNKVYTFINVVGLTSGMVACLAIFMLVRFELGFDIFHPEKDRIYRITGTLEMAGNRYDHGYMPGPFVAGAGELLGNMVETAGFFNYYANVTVPAAGREASAFDRPAPEKPSPVIVAQPGYFKLFQYEWLAGDSATALTAPFKVVLTDDAARRYFGNVPLHQLPGRQLVYNDSLHVTVAGIVKAWRQNSDLAFTEFISFATIRNSFLKNDIDLTNWRSWDAYAQVFIKLPPDIQPHQLEALLPRIVKEHFKAGDSERVTLQLQPLSDLHFNSTYPDAYSRKAHLPTLRILSAIAVFILLLAAVNYANLSAAQAGEKERSAGVRKIMGSSRKGLMLHFLCETAVVTGIAIVLAALLVNPVLGYFDAFLPEGIRLRIFHYSTWLFFGGIGILTILLAGLYPAVVLSSPRAVTVLAGRAERRRKFRGVLGKALITAQFAISLLFITGMLVVEKQLQFMLHKDLGFDEEGIVMITMPGDGYTPAMGKRLAGALRQRPGFAAVSLHRGAPLSARHGNTSIKKLAGDGTEVMAAFEFGDEHMVPLYNMQLAAGRNLMPSDTIREFLVNETCARQLGFANPADAVGQLVQVGISGKKGPVAGVLRDFHTASLHKAIQPLFITTQAGASRTAGVKLTGGNRNRQLADINAAWKQVFPGEKINMTFLDETIAGLYATEQKTSTLVRFAMLTAIVVACIGLFGMAAITAALRAREMGIRKVLGATVTGIAAKFVMEFVKPLLVAVLLAVPLARYAMQRWLENFPFRVPVDWPVLLLAGVAGIAIAMLTLCFQTVKTATANPVESIRRG